jgi:predicted porin
MKLPVSLPVVLVVAGSIAPRMTSAQPAPDPIPLVEVYGTIVPFLEYGHTKGATAPGLHTPATDGPSQVAAGAYTGVNLPLRGIMDPSTTNIGFRGGVELFPGLSAVWQVESAVPVDGTAAANTWASRNTNVGLTGPWGTAFYGNWDTPYSWITKTSINPIKSGNITDYNSIIDNPGFGISSVTTQPTRAGTSTAAAGADAAWERRQGNSVQYWTPNINGFSARLLASVDEGRTNPTATAPSTRPFIAGAAAAFDMGPIKLRAGVEGHWDYFGLSAQGGSPGPTNANPSSADFGAKLIAQYTHAAPGFDTRVVGVAEYLSYSNDDTNMNAVKSHNRPAFYGMIEQTFDKHHIWVGGGKAGEGGCERVGGMTCSTAGLSATDFVVGYAFRASKSFDIWAAAYRISNDFAASYTTSPTQGAPIAPGVVVDAFGIGMLYTFSAKIIGPPTKGPAPAPPANTPTPASTTEPGAVPPPTAPEPPPNAGTPPPPAPNPHG